MGQHCRVALHRLQYFKEQTAWHVNDIYLKILLWTVFSRFPFSVEGLPTVFSFNGNAIRTSGDVLKITALKNQMYLECLPEFWKCFGMLIATLPTTSLNYSKYYTQVATLVVIRTFYQTFGGAVVKWQELCPQHETLKILNHHHGQKQRE